MVAFPQEVAEEIVCRQEAPRNVVGVKSGATTSAAEAYMLFDQLDNQALWHRQAENPALMRRTQETLRNYPHSFFHSSADDDVIVQW